MHSYSTRTNNSSTKTITTESNYFFLTPILSHHCFNTHTYQVCSLPTFPSIRSFPIVENSENNYPLLTPIQRRLFHNVNAVCWPIRRINRSVHTSSIPSFNQTKNWGRSHLSKIHTYLLAQCHKDGNNTRADASPARLLRSLKCKDSRSPHMIIKPIIFSRYDD